MIAPENKKYLLGGALFLAAAALAALYILRASPAAAPEFSAFTNLVGGYSFEVPPGWQAIGSQYDARNSLFGPGATAASGLGGVEIFPKVKSIDAFLKGNSASYSGQVQVVVDGVPGVRVNYQGAAGSGAAVVLWKNGSIVNIYVNSSAASDLAYFDRIVSSFQFMK